jgi:DNA-binding Xre family transcriptional regulator
MNSMIKLRIGDLLGQRKEGEQSLYWLAKTADIEYGSLWRLNQGVSKSISFELLDQICTALKCQPGDLIVQVKGVTPPEMRKSRNAGAK